MTEATLSVTAAVELIGPEEAKELLGLNTRNRIIRQVSVHTMARDMRHGDWRLNGESIKVGKTRLIDGQHRLLAVVESGKVIEMLVIRGLPDDAQDTVDIGSKRTMGDRLDLAGESNGRQLAAAIRYSWYLDNYGTPKQFGINPSAQELMTWFEANEYIRQSTIIGNRASGSVLRYPPSLATSLHYLMGRVNHQQAGEFWDAVLEGTERPGHPTYVLRETLLRDLSMPHRMLPIHRAALTIKAWNFVRDFKTIQQLHYRTDGKFAEEFPKIK